MVLSWWLWLLFGFVLLVMELLTPGGFYVFFFGIGALVVGLLAAAGVSGPSWLQWLLFGAISTGCLLFFRKPLQNKLGSVATGDVDSMIGETAIALADIGVDGIGKVELRGSAWSAKNVGPGVVLVGQRCRVERIKGLMLYISN